MWEEAQEKIYRCKRASILWKRDWKSIVFAFQQSRKWERRFMSPRVDTRHALDSILAGNREIAAIEITI